MIGSVSTCTCDGVSACNYDIDFGHTGSTQEVHQHVVLLLHMDTCMLWTNLH